MNLTRLASASIAAIALAATFGSVSASGQSATGDGVAAVPMASAQSVSASGQSATRDGVTAVPMASRESVSASAQFATLKGVTAVPMASGELDAVKGLHFHFRTPSGIHFVNSNNTDHYIIFGTPGLAAGPGYHGLCRAALRSPALSIPGQSLTTGHGAGC